MVLIGISTNEGIKDVEGTSTGEKTGIPKVQTVGNDGESTEKACIACVTEADLTDNVYTVPAGGSATRIEGLRNNGAGVLTVTIGDLGITKSLAPRDVWDQSFAPFQTLTFSAGAEFEVDIMG